MGRNADIAVALYRGLACHKIKPLKALKMS
jgi:hypothetical protein